VTIIEHEGSKEDPVHGGDDIREVAEMLHRVADRMVATLIAKPAGEKPA